MCDIKVVLVKKTAKCLERCLVARGNRFECMHYVLFCCCVIITNSSFRPYVLMLLYVLNYYYYYYYYSI